MRRNRSIRIAQVKGLTVAEQWELLIGLPGGFKDEDSRRRAWFLHRAELMALLPPDGRGWGWVQYEGGGFLPHEGNRISAALARIDGTLTEAKGNAT